MNWISDKVVFAVRNILRTVPQIGTNSFMKTVQFIATQLIRYGNGYRDEKLILSKCFGGCATEEVLTTSTTVEATEQILKAKVPKMSHGEFEDMSWVPTASNLVERLFSQAKYFLNQYCKKMLPMHLECQLFLMINEQFWDVNLINNLI